MSARRVRAARAGARELAMSCLLLGAGAVERGEGLEQIENGNQLAIAGLHLTRAARIAGVDPGIEPPRLAPAPKRSRRTPHYYPGATADAEWPIPAGWYSDPWWHAVMTTGNESGGPGLGSMMFFDDEFPG